jgi:hypothetical protein
MYTMTSITKCYILATQCLSESYEDFIQNSDDLQHWPVSIIAAIGSVYRAVRTTSLNVTDVNFHR